jgi:hypothetical protein
MDDAPKDANIVDDSSNGNIPEHVLAILKKHVITCNLLAQSQKLA